MAINTPSMLAVVYRPANELIAHPANARTHSKHQIRQIAVSIKTFGFTNPILVDNNHTIIAGHGRVQAAKLLGIDRVPTIHLETLTQDEIRAYLIADNRLAEKAGWDQATLAIELQHLITIGGSFDVTITGFEVPEIDLILEEAKPKGDAGDVFDIAETETSVTEPGDLWVLGKHRIFCANSLDGSSYKTLMASRRASLVFADPPYNVAIDGNVCGKGSIHHRELDYIERQKIRSKLRTSVGGRKSGGAAYSRGALYHLLNNRIYIGEIVHRDQSYPGRHRLIVPKKLWNKVAGRLKENNKAHRTGKSHSTSSLLCGIVFDSKGVRFTPTGAIKNGKRYRYYTSPAVISQSGEKPAISRFPAREIESLVFSQIHLLLACPDKHVDVSGTGFEKDLVAEHSLDLAKRWHELEISKQHEFVRSTVKRVVIGRSSVRIDVSRTKLAETLMGRKLESNTPTDEHELNTIHLTTDFKPLLRGSELRITTPNDSRSEVTPVVSLVKAIARARDWYDMVIAGEVGTVAEIAQNKGLHSTYIKRILGCARLSPRLIESVLSGKHRSDLTLHELLRNVPMDWRLQERRLC